MKQVFDWLRGQMREQMVRYENNVASSSDISKKFYVTGKHRGVEQVLKLVDEAEAKWEEECCEWKSGIGDDWTPSCEPNATYNVFGVAWFKYCPYCGKRIQISEVE